MSQATPARGALGSAFMVGREPSVDDPRLHATANANGHDEDHDHEPAPARMVSSELRRSLAEVKGQAQFLLYLADQIEESLEQLAGEADATQGSFLCKVLGMYSAQLESKHQGLGDKIAETCQEVYVTVREFDAH